MVQARGLCNEGKPDLKKERGKAAARWRSNFGPSPRREAIRLGRADRRHSICQSFSGPRGGVSPVLLFVLEKLDRDIPGCGETGSPRAARKTAVHEVPPPRTAKCFPDEADWTLCPKGLLGKWNSAVQFPYSTKWANRSSSMKSSVSKDTSLASERVAPG